MASERGEERMLQEALPASVDYPREMARGLDDVKPWRETRSWKGGGAPCVNHAQRL